MHLHNEDERCEHSDPQAATIVADGTAELLKARTDHVDIHMIGRMSDSSFSEGVGGIFLLGDDLHYGSDCSGVDTPRMALTTATTRHIITEYVSEPVAKLRKFLAGNYRPKRMYKTALNRPRARHRLHIYVAGPPCQGLAPGGKGLGIRDSRTKVLLACIDNIVQERPLTAVLENSSLLLGIRGASILSMTRDKLHSVGYRLHIGVLDVCVHGGLPHHRERAFIVCIHEDCPHRDFEFPSTLPMLPLEELLSPVEAWEVPERRPLDFTRKRNVDNAWKTYHSLSHDEQEAMGMWWVTSSHHSATFAESGVTALRKIVPTITRGHPRSAWVARCGRQLHTSEVARLQGVVLKQWHWPIRAPIASWMGNAMGVTLLHRILRQLVSCATGDVIISDIVETGTFMETLKRDAKSLSGI